MILFFQSPDKKIIATEVSNPLSAENISKLSWLYSGAVFVDTDAMNGWYVGPRKEMITPWSTNAVEITQNMGIEGIGRIEEYFPVSSEDAEHDPMLQRMYNGLNQTIFTISKKPDPIVYIEDITSYNEQEGLALSADEIEYLEDVSKNIGRKLTDSEVFGFSQVNSEHCRHKIFNGTFIIDGKEMDSSLFQLIKRTSKENPNFIISAYKDNVAFLEGPVIEQFAPESQDKPDFFAVKDYESVISIKAETHNFPTTVEPFNGASTGSGGEIRDRLGGGIGSLPIAGTAVYMTSYARTEEGRNWEDATEPRPWLYQTPEQILIKASNGASDFGNKFGQPLICGSLLTFEHFENAKKFGYDKVIMLAGGVGYAKKADALKGHPKKGDKVVLLGGDNYRIGMGGGAVSSVDTGHYANAVELNAVQRANPEMQKRAANVIRALCEDEKNPIVSIHDHGAGGHLNSLSELLEETGGVINMDKLPVGDPTLSAKEIIGNESQERMGMILNTENIDYVYKIAERERSPMYVVGEATGDHMFIFKQADGIKPIDIQLEYMFGKPPRTYMKDVTVDETYNDVKYNIKDLHEYLEQVLQLEGVACKDWLTNKVDRSVTGKVAKQQTAGEIQLPLNDLGVVALDYKGKSGIASSIGHAPQAAMIDPAAGSVLAVAESLTNIVWAPLKDHLKSVSLSANWMWPCKNEGEDARLYKAVEAISDFCVDLGINVPTGKDSMSMTQKYGDEKVLSPGTVIISAGGEVSDVKKVVSPVISNDPEKPVYYIDFSFDKFKLGGSAFAQALNRIGKEVPTVKDSDYFIKAFNAVQKLVEEELIVAGHDISAGGMITALLEMCFANTEGGLEVSLDEIDEDDLIKILFAENPGILVQVTDKNKVDDILNEAGIAFTEIAKPTDERHVLVEKDGEIYQFGIDYMRDIWYKSSYLLDRKQSGDKCAADRFNNYKTQPLEINFDASFTGKFESIGVDPNRRNRSGVKAAIIREKGVNGDREMAYSMYLAGFDVKDVHMTDLITGRETLEDVNFIVFVGGFSNSDVLGSAKGWAGAFLYNPKAKEALDKFYARKDTLSLGICNGCQLMMELGLVYPDHDVKPKMEHNISHKFESSFLTMKIENNESVMLKTLAGSQLGVWVAHGEGKFAMPKPENAYNIAGKYLYNDYPGNPNGSDFATAAVCSDNGRHLAMMPHLERAIFPWQWAHYPADRKGDAYTPWLEAFVNARKWVEEQN
ncbi:phosphoribosylformylglycinamidine synthase [Saccharicrinis sp. FJH54]|uniref:phosphoribosylformylglycinamidine synthase n=1 Tax=Saccharicrinis sp. FJH54 TaxID=3344665 RepID=UPI0035D4CF3C